MIRLYPLRYFFPLSTFLKPCPQSVQPEKSGFIASFPTSILTRIKSTLHRKAEKTYFLNLNQNKLCVKCSKIVPLHFQEN